MAPSSVLTLNPPRQQPMEAGVEVYTPRGFGTIVSPYLGVGREAYWVELDDDLGRMKVPVADLQVVDRLGS